jgi:hypothetical protein
MQTGESKGYAFIDMMDEPGGARVIAVLDGMTFGKLVMSVRIAEQKSLNESQIRNRNNTANGKTNSNNTGLPELTTIGLSKKAELLKSAIKQESKR